MNTNLFFWFHKSILLYGFYIFFVLMRHYFHIDILICVLIIFMYVSKFLAYSCMLAHICFAMIFIAYILYGFLIGGAIPIYLYVWYSPVLIDRGSFRSLNSFVPFLMLSKGEKYCEYTFPFIYACEL